VRTSTRERMKKNSEGGGGRQRYLTDVDKGSDKEIHQIKPGH
jgi:hypothetical protein